MIYPQNTKKHAAGFTLVELLVVIGLIVFLAGVLSFSLRDPGGSVGVNAGVSTAASMVTAARQQAVLKSREALLIIATENHADPDKALRYMGVVYKVPDGSNRWRAASSGTYLPSGVYFDAMRSGTSSGTFSDTINLEFPVDVEDGVPEGIGDEWYFIKFEPSGICDSPGTKFVVAAGRVADASGTIILSGRDDAYGDVSNPNIGGFIIHRMGTISVAQDISDLD